jgi:hypothetical protein
LNNQGIGAFKKIGIINYAGRDNLFVKKTYDALCWLNKLEKYGKNWSYDNMDSIPLELYPNMNKYYDRRYSHLKKKIANSYNEITQIWNISLDIRNKCIEQKLISYKNKELKLLFNEKEFSGDLNYYIDFETLDNDMKNAFANTKYKNTKTFDSNHLVMIGMVFKNLDIPTDILLEKINIDTNIVGYKTETINNTAEYICFYLKKANLDYEINLLHVYISFLKYRKQIYDTHYRKKQNIVLLHWSPAESNILSTVFDRIINGEPDNENYNEIDIKNIMKNYQTIYDLIEYYKDNTEYLDLFHIFKQHNIIIKNQKGFGLKSVANSFHDNKLINTKWTNSKLSGGYEAMIEMIRLYADNVDIETSIDYQEIIKYNKIDCVVMLEMVHAILKYIK